jgi:hypothetical protein
LSIDKDIIHVKKGLKAIKIEYDEGADLYNIEKIALKKDYSTSREAIKGVFCDQLADVIEEYFSFSYLNKPIFG